jgi:hypothetical protein
MRASAMNMNQYQELAQTPAMASQSGRPRVVMT